MIFKIVTLTGVIGLCLLGTSCSEKDTAIVYEFEVNDANGIPAKFAIEKKPEAYVLHDPRRDIIADGEKIGHFQSSSKLVDNTGYTNFYYDQNTQLLHIWIPERNELIGKRFKHDEEGLHIAHLKGDVYEFTSSCPGK